MSAVQEHDARVEAARERLRAAEVASAEAERVMQERRGLELSGLRAYPKKERDADQARLDQAKDAAAATAQEVADLEAVRDSVLRSAKQALTERQAKRLDEIRAELNELSAALDAALATFESVGLERYRGLQDEAHELRLGWTRWNANHPEARVEPPNPTVECTALAADELRRRIKAL